MAVYKILWTASLMIFVQMLDYSICQTDLCSSTNQQYYPFSYPTNRSVKYNSTQTLTDRFIREDWYGTKDFVIPTQPPGVNYCGTKYPIYLKDPIPNSGKIESVQACIQSGTEECKIVMTIQAMICSSDLTLYRLSRPPLDEAAYCLAPLETGDFPDFYTEPWLTWVLIDEPKSGEKEYEFSCQFDDNNDMFLYKAEWFVDDRSVYESPFTNYRDSNRERTLTDTKLKAAEIYTVGFLLHCEVRAGFSDARTPNPSLPSKSPKKFIGIEVENPEIHLKEGEIAQIKIRPSIEIGCTENEGCQFSVTANFPSDKSNKCVPTAGGTGGCGVQFETKNSHNSWHPINISSTVTTDRGQEDMTKTVFLFTNLYYLSQEIWGNYSLAPVKVTVSKDTSNIEGRYCDFFNDPYLIDFKDRFWSFELDGTFILFKTDDVEIQVQVYNCGHEDTGFCVCGIVIRVGRTVFMINHCNLGFWFIDYILCEDGGNILDVKKKKKRDTYFEVTFPSGTNVKVYLRDNEFFLDEKIFHWLNILITPSVRDYGKTSGLCNELTDEDVNLGIPELELENNEQFYNTWKVPYDSDRNLFERNSSNSLSNYESYRQFENCRCENKGDNEINNVLNCTPLQSTKTCAEDDAEYTNFHKKRCHSPLRKKRSIPTYPNMVKRRRKKRDVSWKNGWTAESAEDYCRGLFNESLAVKKCEDVKGIDIESTILTCQKDIQLSGTDVFALSAVSVVSAQCLTEAKMNRTLRENKIEEGKSVLEIVKEVSCPGECSGRGICEKGKCVCNKGFIGSDCSLPLNKPPLAHSLEAEGYCDLQDDECTEIAVFGGRFVTDGGTKCKILNFKVKNDEVSPGKDTVVQPAIFESIGEVTCKLPEVKNRKKRSVDVPVIDETVTGYKVSVSNNGQDYSQQLTLLIYNSECTKCNINDGETITCSVLSNYCITRNKCYKDGSVYNTGTREFMCSANKDGKSWKLISNDGQVPVEENKDYTIIIIAVVVGVFVLVFIGIFVGCCIKKKNRRNSVKATDGGKDNNAYEMPNSEWKEKRIYSGIEYSKPVMPIY